MRRLVWAAACLTLASCDTPTIPGDHPIYAFWQVDGSVFHWPNGSVVRVFINADTRPELAAVLDASVEHAVQVWNDVPEYHEYSLLAVDRLEGADVVVGWLDAPFPVSTQGCNPLPTTEFAGITQWCGVAPGGQLKSYPGKAGEPTTVRMLVAVNPAVVGDAELARKTVAHEMGHVLGILAHSPQEQDLMSQFVGPATLTDRDRNTVRALYHTRASVRP